MFNNIVLEVSALLGFAAFVSFVVSILKVLNVVKDGTADKWVAGFNLVGVIALFVTRIIVPNFDVLPIDSLLGEIATIGVYIMSFVITLLGSKVTYAATRGLPLIGRSYSI